LDECELILRCRDKRLPEGISLQNVYDAFPELIPANSEAASRKFERRNARIAAQDNLVSEQKNLRKTIEKNDEQQREVASRIKLLTDYRNQLSRRVQDSAATFPAPTADMDRMGWMAEIKRADDELREFRGKSELLEQYKEIVWRRFNAAASQLADIG
jgi:seryl-tRNA synthetase